MDAFVFDTLNTWYQEDMGVTSVSALSVFESFHHALPEQQMIQLCVPDTRKAINTLWVFRSRFIAQA